jgi:ParB-like chromosome segregation protein Spo0J
MINWHLEVLPLGTLKENPKNPRFISKDSMKRLEGLVKKFGMIDKPVVNKDWTIIGGHQRIKLLKKMKSKTVECWIPDRQLDEKEIDELCIGLNQGGSWDWDCMANNYDITDLLNWGFSEDQLLDHIDIEEVEAKDEKKGAKKKKNCPQCGHEF